MSQHRIPALMLLALLPLAGRGQVVPTDLVGDPLPPGAVARIGTVRFNPRPYLQQVFFTPDGATVLGRGGGDVIDLWEAETGKPVGEFRDPDLFGFWIDQSPDSKLLAVYGFDRRGQPAPDTTLRVYDFATRKVLWESTDDQVYRPGGHRVVFTRDGKRLITGDGQDVRLWDAATGKELARHKARVGYGALVLSPDGKTVAFGEDNTGISVWDWESDSPPRKLPLPVRSYFNSLAFSADGKTIYASSPGAPVLMGYDVATGRYLGGADESLARWRATSPDGQTVAVAEFDKAKQRGSVVLKDAATGKEVGRLSSGPHYITSGCWSRDGKRLAGATTYRAWVWDVKTGKAFGPDVPGHTAQITSLAFSTDGRLFTASYDGTVRAWDSDTGKELLRLTTAGPAPWRGVALAPDGDLMAGSPEPNGVRVWDAKTGKEVFHLVWSTRQTGGVYQVRFTADGQTLLTYGHDFYLRAFDTLTGKLKSERKIRPAGFGPEADDDDQDFRGPHLTYRLVDLAPDGSAVVLGLGKEVAVHAADTGKERFKFEGDAQAVDSVVVSPDGKRLAVAGFGPPAPAVPGMLMNRPTPFPVTVWDLGQAKRLAQIVVPATNGFRVLAFSPDGKRLAAGSSQDTKVWVFDAETGAAAGVIDLSRPARHLAFGGDKRLAVGFEDPTVLVYDMAKTVRPVAAKKE